MKDPVGDLPILNVRDKTNVSDQFIQEATASEPLTLEEEHAMQQSWRSDGDKLTFIVCQPLDFREGEQHEGLQGHAVNATVDKAGLQREIDAMIGDVNLFISTTDREEVSQAGSNDASGVLQADSNHLDSRDMSSANSNS